MAKTLEEAPSIYSTPPTLEDGESAFENVKAQAYTTTGLYKAPDGFGAAYAKKASKGGRYMNLTDIRMMYYLGTEYAKMRLYGRKPFWDESFCKSVGGYARGAIIRHPSGKKMISRNENNFTAMPDEYKTDNAWAMVKATHCFRRLYSDNLYYFPLNFQPPFVDTTQTYVVPIDVEYSGLYTFPMMFFAQNQRWWEEDLCVSGNVVLRISKYDDIMSNASHKDSYVTVGQLLYYDISANRLRKSFSSIPLSKGRYYAYIGYENAKATNGEHTGWGPYTRNFRLVALIDRPRIVWPKY